MLLSSKQNRESYCWEGLHYYFKVTAAFHKEIIIKITTACLLAKPPAPPISMNLYSRWGIQVLLGRKKKKIVLSKDP